MIVYCIQYTVYGINQMNKNKIALGVLSVVITAGLIYSQLPLSDDAQQISNNNSVEAASKSTVANAVKNTTTKNNRAGSTLLNSTQPNDVQDSAEISASNTLASSQNKKSVIAKSHQQPADHRSASQPKAHGHENQHRHPEDNSLIPPGEPKKPLPNKEGEG